MSEMNSNQDYDVFEDDLFLSDEEGQHGTIGRWGIVLLHVIKGAFVLYSGAHNIQAALTATGSNVFALLAQIIGVLVLEASISALYMAGMAGKLTGKLQAVIAALFWLIGMSLASMGIVADSRLHAGYELGSLLAWHIQTGLFIAPVIMVLGSVLVVFTDPILSQQIANSRDRASIRREKVKTAVIAEKANHASRKIVHNIRLGAQKQMAIEARKYYKSDEVQAVLQEEAVRQLRAVMRASGIPVPGDDAALSAPETAVDPTRWVVIGDDSGHIYGPYPQAEARAKADEWSRLGFDDHFYVVLWDVDVLGSPKDAPRRQHGWGILHQTKDDLYVGGLIEVEAKRTAATWNQNTGFRYFKAGKIESSGDGADDFLVERPSANGQTNEN